jgi:hypothetical protein
MSNSGPGLAIIAFYRDRLGKRDRDQIKKFGQIIYITGIYKRKAIYSGVKKNI